MLDALYPDCDRTEPSFTSLGTGRVLGKLMGLNDFVSLPTNILHHATWERGWPALSDLQLLGSFETRLSVSTKNFLERSPPWPT